MTQTLVAFGWTWMLAGIGVGMLIGLRAESNEWAGGYDSLRRRSLRLGHISAIALPAGCVLYGQCLEAALIGEGAKMLGALLMVVGSLLMPLVCFATAFANRAKYLFPVPASAVCIAVMIMAWGQIRLFFV